MNSQKLTYQAIFSDEDYNSTRASHSSDIISGDSAFADIHRQLQALLDKMNNSERVNQEESDYQNFNAEQEMPASEPVQFADPLIIPQPKAEIDITAISTEEGPSSSNNDPFFLKIFQEKFEEINSLVCDQNQIQKDNLTAIISKLEKIEASIAENNILLKQLQSSHSEALSESVNEIKAAIDNINLVHANEKKLVDSEMAAPISIATAPNREIKSQPYDWEEALESLFSQYGVGDAAKKTHDVLDHGKAQKLLERSLLYRKTAI